MKRVAERVVVGMAIVWMGASPTESVAQFPAGPAAGNGSSATAGSGGPTTSPVPAIPGTFGGATSGAFGSPPRSANPYANPYMNPFLNPYVSQLPSGNNRQDTLMFFMAAQQARGGLGSGAMPGGIGSVNQRPAVPARASQGRGAPTAGSSSTSRGLAGRVEPPRPAPNRRVPGRFDDNPAINDRRGRLARSYSAYGSFMIVPNGQPMAQGGVPAPNEGVRRYFGR